MIKLPVISEEKCEGAPPGQCLDSRCDDPVWAAQHPELCDEPVRLVIKPEVTTVCAGEITFTTWLANRNGEVQLTDGLAYTSGDTDLLTIVSATGVATVLAVGGQLTVDVTWQDLSASALVTVLADGTTCADIKVRSVFVADLSRSLGQGFHTGGAAYYPPGIGTCLIKPKFYQGASIYKSVRDNWNSKDELAYVRFADFPEMLFDFTSSPPAMPASPLGSSNGTDLASAILYAIDLLGAAVAGERQVICLVSDGQQVPAMSETLRGQLFDALTVFKANGGVMLVCGVAAYGDGFALLQALSTGGYFVNAIDCTRSRAAIEWAKSILAYICGGLCPCGSLGGSAGLNCPGDVAVPAALPDAIHLSDPEPGTGPSGSGGGPIPIEPPPSEPPTTTDCDATLHGDGPPPAGLGEPGNTYVDDLDGSFYWKSTSGWLP